MSVAPLHCPSRPDCLHSTTDLSKWTTFTLQGRVPGKQNDGNYIFPVRRKGLPRCFCGKESACQCGRPGFDPEAGKSPGGGNGDPLQYSCLGNPMDRGALQATVHRVAESDTTERLSKHAHQLALIHTVSPAAFSSNQGERWRGRWLDLWVLTNVFYSENACLSVSGDSEHT